MEYYRIFTNSIVKELSRFKLNIESFQSHLEELTSTLNENFDVPYYRCCYMLRYGATNTYFFKDCMSQFLLDSNAKDLFSEWKSLTDVKVCSLSVGPGLDILAFMLAILEFDPLLPNFSSANVVSKHSAWRNTVNFVSEALQEQGSIFNVPQFSLKYENVSVIQADLLTCFSAKRTITSLSDAHIVLMMRTLNLTAAGTSQESPLLQMLKGLITSLRSNATIFCIDTKPSLALFTQAFSNFPGKFLYGPIHRTTSIQTDFPEFCGSRPSVSCRGVFFVWQKLSLPIMTSLSSSLDTIPLGTEREIVSTVPSDSEGDATSEGEKQLEEEEDSINLPWIELKTFWKTSSPQTKKVLKELMLLDNERIEQIGDFIVQSEKVNIEKDLPEMGILGDGERSFTEDTIFASSNNIVKNNRDNNSYAQTASEATNTFDDILCNKSSPIDGTVILSPEVVSLLKNFEDSNTTISSDSNDKSDTPDKKGSMETKLNSDTVTMSQEKNRITREKVIQTGAHEDTSSTPVKELTEHIRNLVISLEHRVQQQNEPLNCNSFGGSPKECHNQHQVASESNVNDNMSSCSKHSLNNGSTEKDIECTVEKKNYYCNDCYSNRCNVTQLHPRSNCCHNYGSTERNIECSVEKNNYQCNGCHCCSKNIMQLHCSASCCHFQPCCSQPAMRCHSLSSAQSRMQHTCGSNFENSTSFSLSPNIVIPLKNISEEALLKIVSILKST